MLSFFSITQNFGIWWCNFFSATALLLLSTLTRWQRGVFYLKFCWISKPSFGYNIAGRVMLLPPATPKLFHWWRVVSQVVCCCFPLYDWVYWLLFSGRKLGELIPLIPLPSIGKNEEEAFLDLLSFLVISLYISCVSQRREKNCRSSSRPKKLIGKSKLRREKSKEKQLQRIQSSSQHNGGKIK